MADVNPVFTWVRLAPVRIHIDHVPSDILLAVGMTATVQVDPRPVGPHGPTATSSLHNEAEASAPR